MHLYTIENNIKDKCIKIIDNNNLEDSIQLLSKVKLNKKPMSKKYIKGICKQNIKFFVNKEECKNGYNTEYNRCIKIINDI